MVISHAGYENTESKSTVPKKVIIKDKKLLEDIGNLIDDAVGEDLPYAGLDMWEALKEQLAKKILALFKAAGYVRLADDQSFGWNATGNIISSSDCQHCFEVREKAGWRKVEV